VTGPTAPRYTGIRTFAGRPHSLELRGVGAAVLGVPFDTATSFRPGARFGPEGIRSGSTLLRPYHPELDVEVFERLALVDRGDLDVTPGNAVRTLEQVAAGVEPLARADVAPLVLGGDHLVALGELRAQAAVHGPLALVLIDAHADVWDAYYGERLFHGTVFRRALEEGLVDPARSLLAGMRGPLYERADLAAAEELGFELIRCQELRSLEPGEYGRRVGERVREGPVFLSFDIDAIDPAFAPGTGTPEVAGLLPHETLALLRSLAGLDFVGFDVVEVSPPYDDPAGSTSLVAASVAYELLALKAVAS
jgi:agmatinase